jgi:large subunit ribosomal protein L5
MLKKQKILNKGRHPQNQEKFLLLSRLILHYKQIFCPDYILQYPINNTMQIPCLEKVVLNCSSKVILQEKKAHLAALLALKIISAQKSKNTWARKSIAAFKLREKNLLGCKLTLRGTSMYFFIEKLTIDLLPRLKLHQQYTKDKYNDSINCYLDTDGNYNVGVGDPFFFRELETHFEAFKSLSGFNISLVSSHKKLDKMALIFNGFQIPSF